MGIDARILLRLQCTASQADLIEWSAGLCTAIGANKFFFKPELGETAIRLSKDWSDEGQQDGKVYHQDGPSIHAGQGETLLEVSLWSRYYGPGYERGDILSICAIAEWVEVNIPHCQVWYGGDSSGVLVAPFGKAERQEMKQHLYSSKGRDYFKGFGTISANRNPYPAMLPCKICPKDNLLPRSGWGQNYAVYHCAPCGRTFTTHDNGQTWETSREQ